MRTNTILAICADPRPVESSNLVEASELCGLGRRSHDAVVPDKVLERPPFADPRDVVKGVYSSGDSWDMLLPGEARIFRP